MANFVHVDVNCQGTDSNYCEKGELVNKNYVVIDFKRKLNVMTKVSDRV